LDEAAVLLKQQGSDAIKRGDYTEADVCYTQAMAKSPASIHTLYSNRSLARLKYGNLQGALADANQCINAAPTFIKGYHRKGAALEALCRLKEAAQAYKDGYDIRNTNAKEKAFMFKKFKQLSVHQKQGNKENPKIKPGSGSKYDAWKGKNTAMAKAKDDFKKLKEQADAGDTDASSDVGTAYATGYGVEKDIESAKQYWHTAAKAGNVAAQHNFGSHMDLEDGKEWLLLSAAQGHLDSYLSLADIYQSEKRTEEELVWLVKAADEHNSMEAQTRAAVSFFNLGNMTFAAQYFCQASSQMDSTNPEFGTIQHTLGDLYATGTGVAKDIPKAVKFYENAANAGHDGAVFAIHEMYCSEKMTTFASEALVRIVARPLKTAEMYHRVGCAHLLQAKLSEPTDTGQLRTAEMRLKHAINKGHESSSIQLAESAALRQNIPLCNQYLRMYVDGELFRRGRCYEQIKMAGEKYASSVLKTRAELKFTNALVYCSVARDLCKVALDNAKRVEILTSKEHVEKMMQLRLQSLEEDDILAEEEDIQVLATRTSTADMYTDERSPKQGGGQGRGGTANIEGDQQQEQEQEQEQEAAATAATTAAAYDVDIEDEDAFETNAKATQTVSVEDEEEEEKEPVHLDMSTFTFPELN